MADNVVLARNTDEAPQNDRFAQTVAFSHYNNISAQLPLDLYGKLIDKFGDNGLVSALIGRVQGSAVHIELWVMSCRVFKREFELAMFDALVAACRARGVHTIVGAYLPTAKNAPVKGLYPSLGFVAAGETPQRAEYRYDIPAAYAPQCLCIAVNNTTPPKEETP